jgi:hypothetical protein
VPPPVGMKTDGNGWENILSISVTIFFYWERNSRKRNGNRDIQVYGNGKIRTENELNRKFSQGRHVTKHEPYTIVITHGRRLLANHFRIYHR